jgi:DNA-directed RNA polymerase sigma subunit (sigma70/sigma32)
METKKNLNVLQNETCFSVHQKHEVACQRQNCNNWFPNISCQNCSIIGAQNSPWTLQDVGAAYGLTRMRICQIEKKIIFKIKEKC